MATPETDIATQVYLLHRGRADDAPRSMDFARLAHDFQEGKRLTANGTPARQLVRLAFHTVGIGAPAEDVEQYISGFESDYKAHAHGRSFREQRDQFGTTISPDAAIRAAFTGLRDLIDNYHGPALDYLVQTAEYLGYFVIENSEPTASLEIGGQSHMESA